MDLSLFQCSHQVYLEFKSIQQTWCCPSGSVDRCALSQTCYKYKKCVCQAPRTFWTLRAPADYCAPEGAGFVSTICDTGSTTSRLPWMFSQLCCSLVLLRVSSEKARCLLMLRACTSVVSVIVISGGQYPTHMAISICFVSTCQNSVLEILLYYTGDVQSIYLDDLASMAF